MKDDPMDTTPLQHAYRVFLDAADKVADPGDVSPVPPTGEWNADQILAHVLQRPQPGGQGMR
jgi:hypothetical protein